MIEQAKLHGLEKEVTLGKYKITSIDETIGTIGVISMMEQISWKITALTLRCLNKLRYILWENEKKNLRMLLSLGPIIKQHLYDIHF